MIIKVIVPAWQVPEGATVTKPTGEKPYRLLKVIPVYGEDGKKMEMKADEGTFFMVPENAPATSINCIGCDKEVAWLAEREELAQWLEDSFHIEFEIGSD